MDKYKVNREDKYYNPRSLRILVFLLPRSADRTGFQSQHWTSNENEVSAEAERKET